MSFTERVSAQGTCSPRTAYKNRRRLLGKYACGYPQPVAPEEPRIIESNWPGDFYDVAQRDSLRADIAADYTISKGFRDSLLRTFPGVEDTKREGYISRSRVLAGLPTCIEVRR